MAVFNSVFEDCEDEKDVCEEAAFKAAYSAIKEKEESMSDTRNQHTLLVYLEDEVLTEGKPFAGLAAGTFWDMYGRKVVIKDKDISDYVKNTQENIEKYKEKDLPGLPIDCKNHDKAEAAGWITGASEGVVTDSEGKEVPAVYFTVQWTEIGVELISKKIMANFSATFDDKKKVIWGGSLTNWPATRDKDDVPLLDAIELAGPVKAIGLAHLQDESLDAKLRKVRDSFWEEFGSYGFDAPYAVEVFEEFLVVCSGGEYFKVIYTENDEGISFQEQEEWVKVKMQWVEAQIAKMSVILGQPVPVTVNQENGDARPDPDETLEGGSVMSEILLANLSEEDRKTLLEQAKAEVAKTLPEGIPQDALARLRQKVELEAFKDIVDVGEYREQMLAAMEEAMKAEYTQMQAQAGNMLKNMLAEIKRKQDIDEFVRKVTGGTDENPVGLPILADELSTLLSELSDETRSVAMGMFGKVWEKGLTDFVETGHMRRMEGQTPLPEYYARQLDKGDLSIADLENSILGLGDLKQYDLSKWRS